MLVEVTNTLIHVLGDNALDPAMPVDLSGLVGPVACSASLTAADDAGPRYVR
jgi:hypothetical protein